MTFLSDLNSELPDFLIYTEGVGYFKTICGNLKTIGNFGNRGNILGLYHYLSPATVSFGIDGGFGYFVGG